MSAVSYRIRAVWGPWLAITLLDPTPISSLENPQNMLQKEEFFHILEKNLNK